MRTATIENERTGREHDTFLEHVRVTPGSIAARPMRIVAVGL
jgi:hypothetical protein